MGKNINDKLRDGLIWAIECYDVSASPPALNYSKRVDISYRDDVNGYSRAYLLRRSIDAKYALNNLLAELPERRACVLLAWIIAGIISEHEQTYYHSLTYKQQFWFRRDRKTLRLRLIGKNRIGGRI